LAHVLPEVGIFLAKHVGVLSLLFMCIWYCAFRWYNTWVHWADIHHLYLRCSRNVSYTWMERSTDGVIL